MHSGTFGFFTINVPFDPACSRAGAPNCHMGTVDKSRKLVYRALSPKHAASLEPLPHW